LNCRHLGAVLEALGKRYADIPIPPEADSAADPDAVASPATTEGGDGAADADVAKEQRECLKSWIRAVYVEMIGRQIKCELRERMQKTAKKHRATHSYIVDSVVSYLNLVFGEKEPEKLNPDLCEGTKLFWIKMLSEKLPKKFRKTPTELGDEQPPRCYVELVVEEFGLPPVELFSEIFELVAYMLGLVFPDNCLSEIDNGNLWKQQIPFSESDKRHLLFRERIKFSTTDAASLANNWRKEGERENSAKKLRIAIRKYRRILRSDPNCWHVLSHTAECYRLLLTAPTSDDDPKKEKPEDIILWAEYYFKLALAAKRDTFTYFNLGLFLETTLAFRFPTDLKNNN